MIRTLVVDDDPRDTELFREAIQASGSKMELVELHDGRTCLQYLKGLGPYAGRERPDLVVLDVKMPGIDGKELLRRIKTDPALEDLPVVMLSNSRAFADVQGSYKRHASCYMVKPGSFTGLMETVTRMQDFWAGTVSYPSMAT